MNYLNYRTLGAACGVGFLAYCVYFDHKRRSDPLYRDKVRARRERIKEAQKEDDIELPSENDKESIEKFFLNQIESGEGLLQTGEVEKAVKHFSYAVIFCPQPQNLLKYMREVLPAQAYTKLIEHLEIANKRVTERYGRIVADDDVE